MASMPPQSQKYWHLQGKLPDTKAIPKPHEELDEQWNAFTQAISTAITKKQ
ncbi:hypothetical protein [Bacillus alkalicellulosilyticus]|uniref:hypothetical protein n=1 Tax=Alkalihalobacterium alkalicellulosilyticum TaxID=1912214 RepID=UPI00148264E5|nr:hypothetical protein [Bacillus alkalicellulosilyticus]